MGRSFIVSAAAGLALFLDEVGVLFLELCRASALANSGLLFLQTPQFARLSSLCCKQLHGLQSLHLLDLNGLNSLLLFGHPILLLFELFLLRDEDVEDFELMIRIEIFSALSSAKFKFEFLLRMLLFHKLRLAKLLRLFPLNNPEVFSIQSLCLEDSRLLAVRQVLNFEFEQHLSVDILPLLSVIELLALIHLSLSNMRHLHLKCFALCVQASPSRTVDLARFLQVVDSGLHVPHLLPQCGLLSLNLLCLRELISLRLETLFQPSPFLLLGLTKMFRLLEIRSHNVRLIRLVVHICLGESEVFLNARYL
eukprot:Opistho-2@22045